MTSKRSLSTLARRIADQLDTSSVVLRQEPVTVTDLERVERQLRAEADLLLLILRAKAAHDEPHE